ncbi:hypothetical protein MMC14_010458 [Varicellaria rhodocarpa]|nr:hypothetical protein [Varicellaria rhodocarpa]
MSLADDDGRWFKQMQVAYQQHILQAIVQVDGTCLVVDDAPSVGDEVVVVPGKGMVAGPGGAKAVAHHLHLRPATLEQLLADVVRCQGG